jgi:hypothetical protein
LSFCLAAEDCWALVGLKAYYLSIFLHTNSHSGELRHFCTKAARIEPTADSWTLIAETVRLLEPL